MSAATDELFTFDEQVGDWTRRPAWMCACGLTVFPAATGSGLLHTDPPRCPQCAAAGHSRFTMHQVTLTIEQGWAAS